MAQDNLILRVYSRMVWGWARRGWGSWFTILDNVDNFCLKSFRERHNWSVVPDFKDNYTGLSWCVTRCPTNGPSGSALGRRFESSRLMVKTKYNILVLKKWNFAFGVSFFILSFKGCFRSFRHFYTHVNLFYSRGVPIYIDMSNFKCAQFCACVLLILLLTSLQLYVKDQTLKTRIRRARHAPLRIPSPVRELNSTLCPKGRPKPRLDDILCMVHQHYVYYPDIKWTW